MAQQAEIKRRVEIPWWTWDALEDTTHNRTVFITGGLGAGKSFGGQIWDVKRCLQNGASLDDPMPTKSWTVAPSYLICDTLMELTLKVAQDVFGLTEGRHFRLYLTSPKTIDFSPMGLNHQLSFRSADNPKHFVSASLTHWRWSEPGVSKPDTYEKLQDRLRDIRAKVLQGLADGTPEGLNHYSDLADIPGVGRVRHDRERNFVRYIVPTLLQPEEQEVDLTGLRFGLGLRYPADRKGELLAVVAEEDAVGAVPLLEGCHGGSLQRDPNRVTRTLPSGRRAQEKGVTPFSVTPYLSQCPGQESNLHGI